MPEIGATLREARMRARIDVSEIEATTKIRAKYLRALENEEWSLLPGPTFVKSFLRTYAEALGLDGKALVEEYRLDQEHPGDGPGEPIVPSSERRRTRGSSGGSSRGYTVAVVSIMAVIVLLVVLLATNSGGKSNPSGSTHTSTGGGTRTGTTGHVTHTTGSHIVALSLRASSVVYVCLIGDDGHKLIPGLELQPGETTATYHARRFEVTLGNSGVTMVIDGRPRTVTPSSEAIGYSITKTRGRQPLPAGSLPTCR
ncbi:MAG TPA: helix-turn-helix transcriptional regulator [Solirubrobacteraceae bacterium]|nr:helix-turn-helix transcriptional regulator [Solirubrobacteraceae bacterium]